MPYDDAWLAQQLQKPGYRVVGEPASPAMPGETLESALLLAIRKLAHQSGWLFHHVRDSRGCDPGFPDVCCVKAGYPVIMAELKTRTGKVTREQMLWMEVLHHATGIESHLWRPTDWATIVNIFGK